MKTKRDSVPFHVKNLISNTIEVMQLVKFHERIAGEGCGRKYNVEIINKSALVLLVACWESFVEDLASLAFEKLFKETKSPFVFPHKVLTLASKSLREAEDEREIWQLAGDGWRTILAAHKIKLLENKIDTFNTPRPNQIEKLFVELIGLSGLSKFWHWKGLSNQRALQILNELIQHRGDIAHRVKAAKPIRKEYVLRMASFIQRLAAISSNRVGQFIYSRTKKYPWTWMWYGKVG